LTQAFGGPNSKVFVVSFIAASELGGNSETPALIRVNWGNDPLAYQCALHHEGEPS
jgi:hypothetical protein